MAINFQTALGIHEDALRIRSAKAALIASNIANVGTPNYRARDIDFKQALQNLKEQNGQLLTTHANHLKADTHLLGGSIQASYRTPTQGSFDGNTVEIDKEKAAFSENSVRYLSSLQFLSSRFQSMTRALKGE